MFLRTVLKSNHAPEQPIIKIKRNLHGHVGDHDGNLVIPKLVFAVDKDIRHAHAATPT